MLLLSTPTPPPPPPPSLSLFRPSFFRVNSYFIHVIYRTRFTWEKVEDLKMEHCYIAPDYALEAQLFQVVDLAYCFHASRLSLNVVILTERDKRS